jgi:hypothetical protein
LADEYNVRINAVFFRVFRDGDREYLSRAWFRDPAEVTAGLSEETAAGEWNGEYYASFGYDPKVIRDGLKWGYIVAGGGSWYSRTLAMLKPGARIWVNVPGSGYVGVGSSNRRCRRSMNSPCSMKLVTMCQSFRCPKRRHRFSQRRIIPIRLTT